MGLLLPHRRRLPHKPLVLLTRSACPGAGAQRRCWGGAPGSLQQQGPIEQRVKPRCTVRCPSGILALPCPGLSSKPKSTPMPHYFPQTSSGTNEQTFLRPVACHKAFPCAAEASLQACNSRFPSHTDRRRPRPALLTSNLDLADGVEGHQAHVGIREGTLAGGDLLQHLAGVSAAEHGQLPHCPVAVVCREGKAGQAISKDAYMEAEGKLQKQHDERRHTVD